MYKVPLFFSRRLKSIAELSRLDFDYDTFIREYNSFYETCKEVIENYDNLQSNVGREEYILNPQFSLHIVKNRNTTDSIIAQVQWKFPIDGKIKKNKYHTVFISTTKVLGTDLDSPSVIEKSKNVIIEYFREHSIPLPVDHKILDENKEVVDVFNMIRSKLPEILARLNPQFYVTKNKTKSSYKAIVANIKWGFPFPGKKGSPRYISCYIGSESEINGDVKSQKFLDFVKPKVIEYLMINSYF